MDQQPVTPGPQQSPNSNDTPPSPDTSQPPVSVTQPPTTPTSPQPILPTTDSSSSKKILVIVAMVVAVVAGGGVYAYTAISKNSDKTPAKTAAKSTGTSTTKKKVAAVDPNADFARCLRPTDYQMFSEGDPNYKIEYYDVATESTVHGDTVFFKPDSVEFEYPDQITETLDPLGVFYTANKDKYWQFTIQGQIQDVDNSGQTASNKKLASDRADKIAQELVARGFDSARIKKLDPEILDASYGIGDYQRNVTVEVSSQCKPDVKY